MFRTTTTSSSADEVRTLAAGPAVAGQGSAAALAHLDSGWMGVAGTATSGGRARCYSARVAVDVAVVITMMMVVAVVMVVVAIMPFTSL